MTTTQNTPNLAGCRGCKAPGALTDPDACICRWMLADIIEYECGINYDTAAEIAADAWDTGYAEFQSDDDDDDIISYVATRAGVFIMHKSLAGEIASRAATATRSLAELPAAE